MYSYGVSAERSAKQTSYLSILAFVAVGIGLVLVVGTVILALIPVFLAKRSVAISDKAFRSSEGVMLFSLGSDGTGRRKRNSGNLTGYIPSVVDVGGLSMFHDKLSSIVVGNHVKEMMITNASLHYINQRRRKRLALSKRQSFTGNEIILTIKFYIIYRLTCPASCQTKVASTTNDQLINIPTNSFDFSNVPVLFNNTPVTITRIIGSVLYVSPILLGSNTDTATAPTLAISSTTTTTTLSVTSSIG